MWKSQNDSSWIIDKLSSLSQIYQCDVHTICQNYHIVSEWFKLNNRYHQIMKHVQGPDQWPKSKDMMQRERERDRERDWKTCGSQPHHVKAKTWRQQNNKWEPTPQYASKQDKGHGKTSFLLSPKLSQSDTQDMHAPNTHRITTVHATDAWIWQTWGHTLRVQDIACNENQQHRGHPTTTHVKPTLRESSLQKAHRQQMADKQGKTDTHRERHWQRDRQTDRHATQQTHTKHVR